MTSTETRAISWPYGVVTVEALGGMLGPSLFVLPDGRQIAPLHIAPWANEPGGDDLPGILRRLRGEWPCVPFGSDAERPATADWPASTPAGTVDPFPHGFGSNHDWTFGEASASRIALSIAYPSDHPIESLERTVTPDPNGPAIDIELAVNVRRDCHLPISLHPCFRLPATPGAMRIEVEGDTGGVTLPGEADSSSIFERNQYAPDWRQIRLRDGGTLDVSRVPLSRNTEDLVQLLDAPGQASLWNTAEGYRATLSWNKEHYPSLVLWFSNLGRASAPWNGRHLALGLEPVCAAFDLGTQISTADNPISRRGVATYRAFRDGERFVTRYRIEVEAAPLA